jgi:hypothetical protein
LEYEHSGDTQEITVIIATKNCAKVMDVSTDEELQSAAKKKDNEMKAEPDIHSTTKASDKSISLNADELGRTITAVINAKPQAATSSIWKSTNQDAQ